MNNHEAFAPEAATSADPDPAEPACELTAMDPSLGANIAGSSEAVEEGMRKAGVVIGYLERTLTGKDREIEYLKKLHAESAAKFGKLQESIAAMRRERHATANEAMRARGLEAALKKMTAERDRAVAERDGVLQALADQNAAKLEYRFDPRDVQIAELTVKLVRVQRELEETKRPHKPAGVMRGLKTVAADGLDFSA